MRVLRFIPLVAILLGSCVEPISPARDRTGLISATTVKLGAGPAYGLTFVGAFYRYDGLEVRFLDPDQCAGYVYSVTPSPVANFPTVDAGDWLRTQIGGREDTLFKATTLGFDTYELGVVNSVPHTPGDTLTVIIPGTVTGFPPVTLRVRTAEPFVFDPVGSSVDDNAIPLTWTAAPTPGSLILLYLRYSSTGTSAEPDTEIRCTLTDDGVGALPSAYASAWSASDPASRSVAIQRVRQTRVDFDTRTKVYLLSFFDSPTPAGTP